MSPVIKPIRELDASVVQSYLLSQGDDDASTIKWKYFDSAFNLKGERGFACVDGNLVTAFVGLIPFTVCTGGQMVKTAWSCDWYRDPASAGPLGIMLMKRSLQAYGTLYSLGGSEATRAIMPRLSQRTIPSAGVEWHRPLRVGGAVRALLKMARLSMPDSIPLLDSLRWPRRAPSIPNAAAEIVDGIPGAASLFRQIGCDNTVDQAVYDLDNLRWLLERCPALQAYTMVVRGDLSPRSIALFWRPRARARFWRLAFLNRSDPVEELRTALRSAMHYAYQAGGWMMSIMTSRLDSALLQLLREEGFIAAKNYRPLYILNQNRDRIPPELCCLSYLDTDYAYRFALQ